MLDFDYEPFDPRFRENPYQYYKQLHDKAPIYRSPMGYWIISRYDDIREIQSQPQLYSSAAVGKELLGVGQDIHASVPVDELAAGLPVDLRELMDAPLIVATDPPKHTNLRALVNRGFTPKRALEWDVKIKAYVEEFLQDVTPQSSWDVISTLAMPLPYAAVCGILGLKNEDRPRFKAWSDVVIHAAHGNDRGTPEAQLRMVTMMREFILFFDPIFKERRANPGADLISDLVRAEDKDNLTTVEVLMFILALMVAGTETSMKLIGNMVACLLENPDQLKILQENPALLPNAVEETLRYRAPIHFSIRTPVQEVEFRGHVIKPGEIIAIAIGAGNYDEKYFPNPEKYDVTRDARTHMTFGFGVHFCLGAHLARREAITAIGALLPTLHHWRLPDAPLEREENNAGIGYKQVPLIPV